MSTMALSRRQRWKIKRPATSKEQQREEIMRRLQSLEAKLDVERGIRPTQPRPYTTDRAEVEARLRALSWAIEVRRRGR